MVAFIGGKSLNSSDEANAAVFEEAKVPAIPSNVIACFNFLINNYDNSDLRDKAMAFIEKRLKQQLGDKSERAEYKWYYVPLPRAKYIKQFQPHLNFSVDLYIAASAGIHYMNPDGSLSGLYENKYPCIVVGKFVKEIAQFNAPLALLRAISQGNENQYEIVEKDRYWTTWDVNGFEARLPDSFSLLIKGFNNKQLGKSLEAVKLIGEDVGPLITKQSATPTTTFVNPVTLPAVTDGEYDKMVTCLVDNMGYPKTKAEKVAKQVIKKIPEDSLENKITLALSYLSA